MPNDAKKYSVSVIIPTIKSRELLLNNLLDSIPVGYEVIIVDNDDMLLAEKRNYGARKARGDILLFIDDDNVIMDSDIALAKIELIFELNTDIGIIGMMAAYHDRLDMIADGGSRRSMITGFTRGLHTNKSIYDVLGGNYYDVDEVANAFAIRSDLFHNLGGLDQDTFLIDLDEADLCIRVRKAGYRVVMCPSAWVCHRSQIYSCIPNFRRPLNAYMMGRNKILYQWKHANSFQLFLYFLLFLPMHITFYCLSLLIRRNIKMIPYFLKGVFDGVCGNKMASSYK